MDSLHSKYNAVNMAWQKEMEKEERRIFGSGFDDNDEGDFENQS